MIPLQAILAKTSGECRRHIESRVIQPLNLGAYNVPNFGTITLVLFRRVYVHWRLESKSFCFIAKLRISEDRFRQCLAWASGAFRAALKSSQALDPVIHYDRRRDADVDAELHGNFNDKFATFDHFRRQGTALRSQNVGGPGRVAETW